MNNDLISRPALPEPPEAEAATMREILFRGKRLDNGEWVEGWYEMYPFGRWPVKTSIIPSEEAKDGHYEHMQVAPSTIGQYTGLKDKNGKRIFEWDVIKRCWLGAEIIYCVRYDGEYAHFIGNSMNKSGFTTFDNDGEMFEVIGNIHDNPELLEGGDEG